jgi:carbon dioxide concentrating mechanism protein CcmO
MLLEMSSMPPTTLSNPCEWLEAISGVQLPTTGSVNAIGIFESLGWTAAIVALDAMAKTARVEVIQAEWNDMLGSIIKITGTSADVQTALEAAQRIGDAMHPSHGPVALPQTVTRLINRPDASALKAILSPEEYGALIEQNVVKRPRNTAPLDSPESSSMSNNQQALGFIETQGFTAVFEAIDTACKAASVEVVGKEKLGGGYVTVVIRGDVAAVNAAVEAAKPKVEGLGKLIACHVIARPSLAALSLLPK